MDEIKLVKSSYAKISTLDSQTITWLNSTSPKNTNKINNI